MPKMEIIHLEEFGAARQRQRSHQKEYG